MDTGYYKFYRGKWIAVICLIVCAILLWTSFLYQRTVIIPVLCLGFACFLIKEHIIPVLKSVPYIEMTPLYVQINGGEKLLWSDIDRVEKKYVKTGRRGSGGGYYRYRLYPKDIKRYNLSWFHKFGVAPFTFIEAFLQGDDLNKVIEILKEKVPNNNLD